LLIFNALNIKSGACYWFFLNFTDYFGVVFFCADLRFLIFWVLIGDDDFIRICFFKAIAVTFN
jgi:hypothetical protein